MVAGIILSCTFLFTAKIVLPVSAVDDSNSNNSTGGLADLLPNFEEIYTQALTMPFKKAESKIYDPEIAEYYHELIQSTGLGGIEAE